MELQRPPKPTAETEPLAGAPNTATDALSGPPESPAVSLLLREPEAAQASSRGAASEPTETAAERLPAGAQVDTAPFVDSAQSSEAAAAEQPSSLADQSEPVPAPGLAPSVQDPPESSAAAEDSSDTTAALDGPPPMDPQPFVSSTAEARSDPAQRPSPGSDPPAQGQKLRRQGTAEQPGRLSRLSLQSTGRDASAALSLGNDQTGGKQPQSLAAVIDFLALEMAGRLGLSSLQASGKVAHTFPFHDRKGQCTALISCLVSKLCELDVRWLMSRVTTMHPSQQV